MKKINPSAFWEIKEYNLAEFIEALQFQNEALKDILRSNKLHEEDCDWHGVESEPMYDHTGEHIGFLQTHPLPCNCILSVDNALQKD